jgi:hypothetical protein
MPIPAECPQCEKEGKPSRHWVESENYPGSTPLPVLALCPACQAERQKAENC